jgi:predicted ATP-dependent endonuclease of OLD family
MRIEFVEIQNFRKLKSVRIDFSSNKTLFVGANNSGKTTAMVALRRFLIDQNHFDSNDFTLSAWKIINQVGLTWEDSGITPSNLEEWENSFPAMDVWLKVDINEIHY